MRKHELSPLKRLLCILLSILLVVQSSPLLAAHAQEVAAHQGAVATGEVEVGAEASLEGFDITAPEGNTLSKTLVLANGCVYHVVLSYDDEAGIHEDAELVVREVEDGNVEALRSSLEPVLELEDSDRILQDVFLDVHIEADGQVVVPASAVEVTIQTNAIDPAQSASAEVALLPTDNDQSEGMHFIPDNLTEKDAATKLGFSTDALGILSLATVAGRAYTWQERDLEVTLLGPRYNTALSINEVASPDLEEGVEPLDCVTVQTDPNPSYGITLWLEAQGTQDTDTSELGGTVAYSVKNGIVQELLFGADGTSGPVSFNAQENQVLLAWDSGYRNKTIHMSKVTVEGMVPESTTGTAQNVSKEFSDPADLVRDGELHEQLVAGTKELSTIAAYDITLKADGQEYQPGDEHPLTVTIANAAITPNKDLSVWHVHDDGSVEAITGFQVSKGALTFETTSFSDFVVAEANDTQAEATRTSFTLKARAKTYGRDSDVTFVDTNKNPLPATVSNSITCTYTGIADESNSTNTVDMYSFIDKLSSRIADEYEFNRVYVVLDKTYDQQKDFRYVQVGDDCNIKENGSSTTYRAYFYMTDISQNREGEVYHGTWYTLNTAGIIDPIYIEYYHVAEASFRAEDTRGNPVQGAKFTLYTDSTCYVPFEYKGQVVTATSNKKGAVSFGKIPYGTYYMKETYIPEEYKQLVYVTPIVVDGESSIETVVHADSDGSVLVSNAKQMTITKTWEGDEDHSGDNVEVTISTNGEENRVIRLGAWNNDIWTATVTGLDPNRTYEIEETQVLDANGNDLKDNWVPDITPVPRDEHIEYLTPTDSQSNIFIKDKEYVLVAPSGAGGYKALTAVANKTTLVAQTVTVNDGRITSEVTDYMLWEVTKVSGDGVITLKNVGTNKYLDYVNDRSIKWFQNEKEPQFVRHLKTTNEVFNIYYRTNLNNTTTMWLYMANRSNNQNVDRSSNNNDAASFSIYKAIDVKTYDVTITNKHTTHPVKIQNVVYPNSEALPYTDAQMEYALYENSLDSTPKYTSLTADDDGYLTASGNNTFKLKAGSYYLKATSNDSEYSDLPQPVGFTVTPKGAMSVQNVNGVLPYYASGSTVTEGEGETAKTYPLLRILREKTATVEVELQVEGDYADYTKSFKYTITLPEGMDELQATVNGVAMTFSEENTSFTLAHGQKLRLESVPTTESYVITQADSPYNTTVGSTGPVTAIWNNEGRTLTLSELSGTTGRVILTNTLTSDDVPSTGIADNASTWGAVVITSACALAALWWWRRRSASAA